MPRPLFSVATANGLCFGFPAPLSLFGAADIGFVNLDSAGDRAGPSLAAVWSQVHAVS